MEALGPTNATAQANAAAQKGAQLREEGKLREAIEEFQEGLSIAKKHQLKDIEMRLYGGLSKVHRIAKQEQESAEMDNLVSALNAGVAITDLTEEACTYCNYFLGNLLIYKNHPDFFSKIGKILAPVLKWSHFSPTNETLLWEHIEDFYLQKNDLWKALEASDRSRYPQLRRHMEKQAQASIKVFDGSFQKHVQKCANKYRAAIVYYSWHASKPSRIRTWIIQPDQPICYSEDELTGSLQKGFPLIPLHSLDKINDIAKEGTNIFEYLQEDYEPYLKEWSEAIVSPIEKRLLSVGSVCFIPSGPLVGVPFNALKTNDQHLIEQLTIWKAPSLITMALIRYMRTKPNQTIREDVAIIANPSSTQSPLPSATEEITHVSQKYQDYKVPVTVLEGEQTKIEAIQPLLEKSTIAHFICHGSGQEDEGRGALLIKGTNKSFLGVDSIKEWNLHSNLIFLGTCSTGLGRGEVEGMVGMSYAFLWSGATSVVANMWEVHDRFATGLGIAFHSNAAEIDSTLASLKWAVALQNVIKASSEKDKRLWILWGGLSVVGAPG